MDQLTQDLPGVAVYLDDLLISGKDAEDHAKNLRALLQRLSDKGLRCRLEKCRFAEPWVEYLGHLLSSDGVAKGPKVNDLLKMSPPNDISSLKSFLDSAILCQVSATWSGSYFWAIVSPDEEESTLEMERRASACIWKVDESPFFRKCFGSLR